MFEPLVELVVPHIVAGVCGLQDSAESLYKLKIQERSRTALWRLIDATAKSSSSLNTYPIPDFFGPAAMQRETFSRARKILGIRILPRSAHVKVVLVLVLVLVEQGPLTKDPPSKNRPAVARLENDES